MSYPNRHDQIFFGQVKQAWDMGAVLRAYLRNPAFQTPTADFHLAADLTGQANHLAATLQADIIKQKQPENNGGFSELHFGKTHPDVNGKLAGPHPIDSTRYQVLNCFPGRAGLINSGGASGLDDLRQAVRTAVIHKRAGGMGMISGRKAFQKSFREGVDLLQAIQDVYLDKTVTLA